MDFKRLKELERISNAMVIITQQDLIEEIEQLARRKNNILKANGEGRNDI